MLIKHKVYYYLTTEEADEIRKRMRERGINIYKASILMDDMSTAMISFILNGRRGVNDTFRVFCKNWLGYVL